ncbi:hypothetical protein F5884DRAFT_880186 [Xylogone sp. PMI_703]|nr:hypothetical protein F5884DRAFT_880186 [Xylogone sp. PMI_703]
MFNKEIYEYSPTEQDDIESVDHVHSTTWKKSTWDFSLFWMLKVMLVLFLLLFTILGTFSMFYSQLKDSRAVTTAKADGYGFFPDLPMIQTKFADEGDYLRFDEVGDKAWDAMIPNGAGYVRVPYPRQYGLNPSVPYGINDSEEAEIFQASVVHQLHCLGALRYVLQAYKKGEILNNKYDSIPHMTHCLNNLRQGILCASDPTLTFAQPKLLEDGTYEGKYQGIGAVHQCRNWEATREFLVEHRAKEWNKTIGET